MSFDLSAELAGHSQDVRALAPSRSSSSIAFFSASRDASILGWSKTQEQQQNYESVASFQGHSHFINSLLTLPASEHYPMGLVISGSADKTILVFDVQQPLEPIRILIGHSDNVCALASFPSRPSTDQPPEEELTFISGSWDKTAKVWRNGECLETLSGHSQAVWAVLGLENHEILTGAADKQIKKWKNGKCIQTITGHTDAVRSLARIPNIGFVSVSNDSTLRIWTLGGDCLYELSGHTSFVYNVYYDLMGGYIFSAGEDRTVRVWKDYQCVQTISHPCTSVWCVTSLENGDIVSGGSDGVVRVFTRSSERVAGASEREAFMQKVESFAIPSNQVGDVDKSKLPGIEALEQAGKPDQVIMIRVGDVVEAHQYSASEGKWQKIGQVVDAVGNSRKQLYDGVEYDYVFDIDIGMGANLKLPFNVTENPYAVAQEFIYKHELSQDFLDQIANFIISNAKIPSLGQQSTSSFADPFTGGSRYVPGQTQPANRPESRPMLSKPLSSVKSSLFPLRDFVNFRAINAKAVQNKIIQLNSALTGAFVLSEAEVQHLNHVIECIQSPQQFKILFKEAHVYLLMKLAFEWPSSSRFPGIDLVRVCLIYSSLPIQAQGKANGESGYLINMLIQQLLPVGRTDRVEAVVMLALRALTNMFSKEEGVSLMYEKRSEVISKVCSIFDGANTHIRLAGISVLLNYVIALKQRNDDHMDMELVETFVGLLKTEGDEECEYRVLMALGTLMHENTDMKQVADVMEIKSVLKKSRYGQVERIATLHRAILELKK